MPLHLGVSHLETYLWPNPHDLGNLLPWNSKEIPNTPSRYKINTSKQLTVHQLREGGLTVCLTQCDHIGLPTGSSTASPSVTSAATRQASFSHHLMRSPTKTSFIDKPWPSLMWLPKSYIRVGATTLPLAGQFPFIHIWTIYAGLMLAERATWAAGSL